MDFKQSLLELAMAAAIKVVFGVVTLGITAIGLAFDGFGLFGVMVIIDFVIAMIAIYVAFIMHMFDFDGCGLINLNNGFLKAVVGFGLATPNVIFYIISYKYIMLELDVSKWSAFGKLGITQIIPAGVALIMIIVAWFTGDKYKAGNYSVPRQHSYQKQSVSKSSNNMFGYESSSFEINRDKKPKVKTYDLKQGENQYEGVSLGNKVFNSKGNIYENGGITSVGKSGLVYHNGKYTGTSLSKDISGGIATYENNRKTQVQHGNTVTLYNSKGLPCGVEVIEANGERRRIQSAYDNNDQD